MLFGKEGRLGQNGVLSDERDGSPLFITAGMFFLVDGV